MTSAFTKPLGLLLVCLVFSGASGAQAGKYVGPWDLAPSKDGKSLFIVCLDAHQIAVLDIASGRISRRIDCPAQPTGLALSPDGATLFVTCTAPQGTVAFVSVSDGRIVDSIPVGPTPCAPTVAPDGKRLYVCNRFRDDVSVIDVAAKKKSLASPSFASQSARPSRRTASWCWRRTTCRSIPPTATT